MRAEALSSHTETVVPKKPTRVLLVLNEMDWFWSHRLPLARAIVAKDWRLTVACHDATRDSGLADMGVAAVDVPRINHALNFVGFVAMLMSIANAIKRNKPDAIHVITLKYCFLVGLVCKLIGFKPVIFTIAGLGSLFSSKSRKLRCLRFLVRPLLKVAFSGVGRSVVFQNPDDREIFLNLGLVNPEQTYLIRGSGVDLDEFPFVPYEQKTRVPKICFASRLLREKGILDFIEAARRLKKKGLTADFIVAGDVVCGNSRFIPRDVIEHAHDEGVVEWRGKVSNIRKLMEESMMVVFPSYYGEGVPKVLLEAAAIGRPIVTCDMPGCREIVKDGVNGIITQPRDPEALAAAIEDLVQCETTRQAQGLAGRRMVEESFNSQLVVRQTMDVYAHVLRTSHLQLAVVK